MKLPSRAMPWVVLLALALAGCGYRFAGGGGFPSGVTRVAVSVFENRTSEPGLGNTLANDLTYELSRSGQVQVTEPKEAQAMLRGTVRSLSVRSVSRSQILTSKEERVTISVDVVLEGSGGSPLWKGEAISEDQAYSVSGTALGTEENRRKAISQLSRRLAEKIYRRIVSNF